MASSRTPKGSRGAAGLTAALLLAVFTGGCQHVENPFRDETISADRITTSTAQYVDEHHDTGDSPPAERGWPKRVVVLHSGSVSHWPLWWEDPFEDRGSQDAQFAWTEEDALAFVVDPSLFLINLGGLPISLVRVPPGTIMNSDGVASPTRSPRYPFDAEIGPGKPQDVGETDSITVISPDDQPAPPGETTDEPQVQSEAPTTWDDSSSQDITVRTVR
jgi:hypothetical protein